VTRVPAYLLAQLFSVLAAGSEELSQLASFVNLTLHCVSKKLDTFEFLS